MKICHIITALGYGGAERLLVNSVRLHAARHSIRVIYLKDEPLLAPEFPESVEIHLVPLGKGCIKGIRAKLIEWQPEVLHTHLGHADFAGQYASRRLPMARVCTMHNIWFKWDWRDQLYFTAYKWMFRHTVPNCHVVGIGKSVTEHIRGRLGVPADRSSMIYNGIPEVAVDGSVAKLRAELEIPKDAFCVLFVGRLHVQKDVDTLLRATAHLRGKIPSVQVLLVGKGAEQPRLEELSRQLGVDDVVRFCGTTAQPENYFAAADAFVLPSVFEGFGLVILEAFRAGLPVISTNIEGPAELIENGVNGLLIEPKDDTDLADKLAVLARDPAVRQRLGEAGGDSFRRNYTIEIYSQAVEALYETLTPSNSRTRSAGRPASAR